MPDSIAITRMFIRRIRTRTYNGTDYHRLPPISPGRIETLRQRTLLDLGADFSLPKDQWPTLCTAIDAGLTGQHTLFSFSDEIVALAESICTRLAPAEDPDAEASHHHVDLRSMRHINSRSVGGETVAIHALRALGFDSLCRDLGLKDRRTKLAMAQVIARMLHPASELETFKWLEHDSATLELLNLSQSKLELNALYRVADALYAGRASIEQALYSEQCRLFGHGSTVMLYDLTNTYLSGAAHLSPGQFGWSKQKRHDCPLVTLALSLDEAGCVRRSEVVAGNVSEPGTLRKAIRRLGASGPVTVLMDAGIVSEDNLRWLGKAGHDWVVVDRQRPGVPQGEPDAETSGADRYRVRIWRLPGAGDDEWRLCVHSAARERTEQSMHTRARQSLDADLEYLNDGLRIPRRLKRYPKVLKKVGRLRQQHRRVSAQYDIEVIADADGNNAIEVRWKFNERWAHRDATAGIYLLRTSLCQWDEVRITRLYWTLSDVEATFSTLKSELGLRPVYHRTLPRVRAHLFISVLAYQAVHYLRLKMGSNGERHSWQTIRRRLANINRITTELTDADGDRIQVRQNTHPDAQQRKLLSAMGVTLQVDQQIGRWSDGVEFTKVVS